MATAAQCAYCFEILAADLENREPLEYDQLLVLWTQFEQAKYLERADEPSQDNDDFDNDLSGEAGKHETESSHKSDLAGNNSQVVQPNPTSLHSGLRLPDISRVQASSPASESSASSIPSSSSSTAALGANSKSSSKSSIFSFGHSKQPSPATLTKQEYPLFVTWNTISPRSGHKSLRGCIGTFEPQELSNGLRSYALTAAFDDTRFAPISSSELQTLSNSITLLTAFTPCSHPFDWDIGTHGIRISFSHHGKRYGATYLPDVALEQGWSKEECLISLMRKAGWNGRRGEWKEVKSLNVVRYEGKQATMDYPVWREWREWVKSN